MIYWMMLKDNKTLDVNKTNQFKNETKYNKFYNKSKEAKFQWMHMLNIFYYI